MDPFKICELMKEKGYVILSENIDISVPIKYICKCGLKSTKLYEDIINNECQYCDIRPLKKQRIETHKNLCISCGIDMGDCNPRQLCGKTYCLYEPFSK